MQHQDSSCTRNHTRRVPSIDGPTWHACAPRKSVLEEREKYISDLNRNYNEIISKTKEENEHLNSNLAASSLKLDEKDREIEEITLIKDKIKQQLKSTNEKYNKAVSQLVENKQDVKDLEEKLKEQENIQDELKAKNKFIGKLKKEVGLFP